VTARPDVAIFGAGAWGTALAVTWARQGARVALWGRDAQAMARLALERHHPRLQGTVLPEAVRPLADPRPAFQAPFWVSALPTQASPEVWTILAGQARHRPELLLHVSKGILQDGHRRLTQALEPALGIPVGVLSGPSFADEVALDLPAAVLLALPPAVEDERARQWQALIATPNLRVYLTRDVVGVELCGAFKNVLAIAAGLVESLGLGSNARAALITRGLAEMARLVEALGGRTETVMGLAGMGDLLLTATGAQSRNRRFGAMLGRGMSVRQASLALDNQVVEGVFTTQAALDLAAEHGLELPITAEVARLLQGDSPEESVKRLMMRSLKQEG
jgi:glycerol-3-phosphate dehydrogenase (NAD(P)+)